LVQPTTTLIEKPKIVNTSRPFIVRVDGIIINSELHLMEIECIEPDLYFNLSENALERFVNAGINTVILY
jgi:hypothetical protein